MKFYQLFAFHHLVTLFLSYHTHFQLHSIRMMFASCDGHAVSIQGSLYKIRSSKPKLY